MIFIVPAKGGKAHADVEPRNGHSRDVALDVSKQGFLQERHDVQVPRILGIWIQRILFDRGKPAAVGCGVNVSAILNLDRFRDVFNKAPELSLHIVFGRAPLGICDGIKLHSRVEIVVLETVCLFLELFQRVDTTFLKAVVVGANQTS